MFAEKVAKPRAKANANPTLVPARKSSFIAKDHPARDTWQSPRLTRPSPGSLSPSFAQVPLSSEKGPSIPASLPYLRSRVTGITGIDVSSVPVRNGNTFGKGSMTHQGRVTLGPGADLHVTAHELVHAAQQRASTGEWIGAGEAERRADHAATAVLAGREAQIAVGRVPEAAIQGANDPYSREALTLAPPPAGKSPKDMRDLVDLKVQAGDITGYSISAKDTDPEAVYLLNAIGRLANKARWGSELDIITDIGSGKGEVTVRFNAAGRAEAVLIGKSTPVVPAPFKTEKDATDELIRKYKLAGVKGEHGKKWGLDNLHKVLAAWSVLLPAEAASLAGFTLILTDSITLNGESVSGLTDQSDKVDAHSPTPTHTREIRITEDTFTIDTKSFIGDQKDAKPASFELLVHEAGHAIEGRAFADLNAVAVDDTASANKAGATAHTAELAGNAAFNAARRTRFTRAEVTIGTPLVNAISAAITALKAFELTPDTAHETAAKTAIADRDNAKAAMPAGHKVLTAFARAITAQDAYFTACEATLAAFNTATASTAKADALKSGTNTKRLQAFVDFVKKESITPPTAYAARHWPSEPSEFMQEAFSLWKNDPTFFHNYSPKLEKWFNDGNHLK